ncbi:MAG: DNA-processing protein DprA, partial [Gammaproteobacteria bacterium]|nr:DNA-processing protein DprA [Gammaproteobacteria bacterium]
MASDIGQPESSMASREARLTLALLRVPGIGSLTLNRLLSRFESAEAVFSATRSALEEIPQIPQNAVDQIITGPNLQQIQQDLNWLDQQPGRTLLHRGHPDYPSLLLEIHDPPPVIFVNGDVALLSRPQLAIVGSRNATASGVAFAREIAAQLAVTGIVITSGLATGIDAA